MYSQKDLATDSNELTLLALIFQTNFFNGTILTAKIIILMLVMTNNSEMLEWLWK
jgi:hypothetical protein